MSKILHTIGNGFISFADPLSPNEVLKLSNGTQVSRKTGLKTIRSRVNLVMPGWAVINPQCNDICQSVPHDDLFLFQMSNLQTTDAASKAKLRAKLVSFQAHVLAAFDAGLSSGSLPSPLTEFTDVV